MKTRTLYLLLLFFILTSLQCNKNKSRPAGILPGITHEGKNTFGCKIDGEVWIPYHKCPAWGGRCKEIAVGTSTMTQASLPLNFAIHVQRVKDGVYSAFEIDTYNSFRNGISTIGLKSDSLKIVYYDDHMRNYEVRPTRGSTFKFEITHLNTCTHQSKDRTCHL